MSTEKVEINSKTVEPSTDEQVQNLKKQGIDVNTLQSEDGTTIVPSEPDTQPETVANQRPEWLPEKFKSAEELSKAYSELEKKFSTQKSEEPKGEEAKELAIPKEEVKEGEFSLDKYSEEFVENGVLSTKSYDELAGKGLSREIVDGYIAGQKSIADKHTAEIQGVVGGSKEYGELIDWAGKNLSEAEQKSFNDLTAVGTTDQIKLAVQGLMVKAGVTGKPQQQEMFQGDVNNTSVEQFNSVAQVTDAMNDPRYEKDPIYRKEVERKLSNSSVF